MEVQTKNTTRDPPFSVSPSICSGQCQVEAVTENAAQKIPQASSLVPLTLITGFFVMNLTKEMPLLFFLAFYINYDDEVTYHWQ